MSRISETAWRTVPSGIGAMTRQTKANAAGST